MSGIAGIIRFDGGPAELNLVERMTSAMRHRGPDGISHWHNGSVAFGHCLLRATPESLEEIQPLQNEDGSLVLVLDGRLDNWEELRRELLGLGALLRTRSDSELVLRAYETWGQECLTHIDGDFAFVIWDERRREAFCARDRMGMRPFYYHWNGRQFFFASELHPLLDWSETTPSVNEGMIAEFLSSEWISRDETFWNGIHRLVAANSLIVNASSIQPATYWIPELRQDLRIRTDEDYVDHYLWLLTDTVRRHSRSSSPIAFEVSGGLDSSAVFAIAAGLNRKGSLLAPSLRGYTLAFADGTQADEREYAHAVARHTGQAIEEIAPTVPQLSWYQERARLDRDFPTYPNSVMGLGIREAAQRQGCRVLLGGNGGDEWLWGSEVYYAEALEEGRWREAFEFFRSDRCELGLRATLYRATRFGLYPLLPETFRLSLRTLLHRDRSSNDEGMRWLTPHLRSLMKERTRYRRAAPLFAHRNGQRTLMGYLKSPLSAHILEQEERMAARAGIELRHPFFATPIVQLAFSTPERLRMRGARNKIIHRRAMVGILPETVRLRTTKADFLQTYWSRLAELRAERLDERHGPGKPWVTPDGLSDMFQSVCKPQFRGWPEHRIWSLFGCSCLINRDM